MNRANKKWTDEEKNFVFDNWGEMPLKKMSKTLGRTVTSLRRFADRNNLGSAIYGDIYLTTKQCADIIGVDPTSILNWIESKQLKLGKKKLGQRKIYLIDPHVYRDFLRNNQDKWNATRLQEGFFDNNLDWLIKKLDRDSDPVKKKANTVWTIKDELLLLDLVDKGYNSKDIAKHLNRTPKSVQSKKERLLKNRSISNE